MHSLFTCTGSLLHKLHSLFSSVCIPPPPTLALFYVSDTHKGCESFLLCCMQFMWVHVVPFSSGQCVCICGIYGSLVLLYRTTRCSSLSWMHETYVSLAQQHQCQTGVCCAMVCNSVTPLRNIIWYYKVSSVCIIQQLSGCHTVYNMYITGLARTRWPYITRSKFKILQI